MIGVVAFTLAKCREVLGQIEFGIGLLGIVVIATGTAIVTTIVVASITIALLALMTLETRNDLFARFDSGLLFLLLFSFLFFLFFRIWISVSCFLLLTIFFQCHCLIFWLGCWCGFFWCLLLSRLFIGSCFFLLNNGTTLGLTLQLVLLSTPVTLASAAARISTLNSRSWATASTASSVSTSFWTFVVLLLLLNYGNCFGWGWLLLWLGCSLGSLGSLVSLVEHFKGVNVLNVALHLLIIFINGQTETVGDVNGILSLDPGHFYLGSTGRTRVSVAVRQSKSD